MIIYARSREQVGFIVTAALEFAYELSVEDRSGSETFYAVDIGAADQLMTAEELAKLQALGSAA